MYQSFRIVHIWLKQLVLIALLVLKLMYRLMFRIPRFCLYLVLGVFCNFFKQKLIAMKTLRPIC